VKHLRERNDYLHDRVAYLYDLNKQLQEEHDKVMQQKNMRLGELDDRAEYLYELNEQLQERHDQAMQLKDARLAEVDKLNTELDSLTDRLERDNARLVCIVIFAANLDVGMYSRFCIRVSCMTA